MTISYVAPNPVTNLTATWKANSLNGVETQGVDLSWTASTITDIDPGVTENIGSYEIYVLCQNINTQQVEPILFTTLSRHAKKTSASSTTYLVSSPATSTFFPFTWSPPTGYQFVQTYSYSFYVVAVLLENPILKSTNVPVTVFQPSLNAQSLPTHLNPRFSISSQNSNFANPVYSGSGSINTFIQDTYDEVASCIEMLLNTVQKTRSMVPQFGIEDLTFTNVDPGIIRAAIKRWEPRADVNVSVVMDDTDATSGAAVGAVNAKVNVNIVSINSIN